jgi:hypothetical protein
MILPFLQAAFESFMDLEHAVVLGIVAHIISRADVGVDAQDNLAPEGGGFRAVPPGSFAHNHGH